eukprot:CAMPEP_0119298886 /NCGR_PEP_ID=MMETSP1333-20130426/1016_1 /TAXON_ID=418940 /ORGANISM="Scyphosphaera apsteinii, Strain RCC1455" /LENGTH=253 /DNA_ID=CAMNT_0007300113 /DNA_START=276 /DNA_END=1032 /DNA_ORIENTATION=+
MPTRVFLNGVAALNTWSHRSGVLQSRCDVLGLGQVAAADGALLLVSPCNRPHKQVVTEYIEQTDWKTLQAVQSLLARAYDRPIIMLNADLEALVLHRHASRPVRPTFMADFVHAYYLATRPPSQSSFLVSECVAVRRAYPADWEVFASSNVHSSSSQPLETILKRCCKSKPYIADTLIEEGVNAFAGAKQARAEQRAEAATRVIVRSVSMTIMHPFVGRNFIGIAILERCKIPCENSFALFYDCGYDGGGSGG